jgi:prepilin-type N-terminal cleavage/methylation domain-containing protein
MAARHCGFTLVEIAIVLVIVGLLIGAIMQGEQLIRSARVRSVISEQEAVGIAVLAFQDRYRALPGDYREASTAIGCAACADGNGNGRIETTGSIPEYILVWSHLAGAGFLNASFAAASGTTTPSADNTPTNAFGAHLQVIFDENWGYSANATRRHNVKTGNQIPVEILAEVDRKMDDGLPTFGRFQFSPYAAVAPAPAWGGAVDSCTTQDLASRDTLWNLASGQGNCGGATLL